MISVHALQWGARELETGRGPLVLGKFSKNGKIAGVKTALKYYSLTVKTIFIFIHLTLKGPTYNSSGPRGPWPVRFYLYLFG